jgi:hypothetical protein
MKVAFWVGEDGAPVPGAGDDLCTDHVGTKDIQAATYGQGGDIAPRVAGTDDVGTATAAHGPVPVPQQSRTVAQPKPPTQGELNTQRQNAEVKTHAVLKSGVPVTPTVLYEVMKEWRCHPNFHRRKVTRRGAEWVPSDTTGLV